MSYDIQITDTATGETRSYTDPYLDEHGHEPNGLYIWEEGNYSCNCNRSLFFARAVGTPEDEIAEPECGDKRFTVRIVRDGETVYEE